MKKDKGRLIELSLIGVICAELIGIGGSLPWRNNYFNNYTSAKGYPPVLMQKTASWPNIKTYQGYDMLYFYTLAPNPALTEGVDASLLDAEWQKIDSYGSTLDSACATLGLTREGEALTPAEMGSEADIIHAQLGGYYSQEKDMPKINFELDKVEGNLYGVYDHPSDTIDIYKPPQATIAIDTLVHELSHQWLGDESLTVLATEENLIRIAKVYGAEYYADKTNKEAGRLACLYSLASINNLSNSWLGMDYYLTGNEQIDPKGKRFNDKMIYFIIPGFVERYTVFSDNIAEPRIETNHGYGVDISHTQALIRSLLSPDGSSLGYPFH
jgi:hypothetical protein